ncbi:histidinol-phosphate transaminase [Desulfocurvibacter africanus]|uniref:histidinol-phosphate transaminase n=1 Tax=Desulfocurvibacter africanus TaxID=873 RepID=UPI0003F6BC07|nr:histidinol-phosphate transaminase [Desulfocurvibacter africanus]
MSTPISTISVRPEAQGFKPYSPGLSIDEIKQRYGLAQVIKLASNENPLGVSPVVRKVLESKAALAFRYPQCGYPRLRQAMAEALGVDVARIVAGNGSDEIIDLLVRVLCRPGQDHVLAARPCFSVYGSQALICGVEFRQVDLNPDYSLPLTRLAEMADERTALVFVTSPDNPTGVAAKTDDLEALARALPKRTLLAVDEAYIHFVDDEQRASLLPRLASLPNVALLRTFSKAYGLAGLRLGLGVLPPELTDIMLRVQIPFSVNLLAEEAGIAALSDHIFYEETLRVTREGRTYLMSELAALNCAPQPSQSNFIMFTPHQEAKAVFEGLLRRGIIVRPLASYGLADKIRVSVGRMDENQAFVSALREVLGA